MPYLFGICGSTRTGSSNHQLLSAAQQLAKQQGMNWILSPNVVDFPQFSPDQADGPPQIIAEFQRLIDRASGILICSPEYVHGIPGALKNALDWCVATTVFDSKPSVLWTAAPTGGEFAHPQLMEVLRTMSANVLAENSLQISNARKALDASGAIIDDELRLRLQGSMSALCSIANTYAAAH
jgi:chromate reductase, NAD(P)H dehydrogenase (quinone)